LKNKKQHLALVITITTLTIVARSLYIGFDRETQSRLIPDYMNALWPLAYYYVGAFIREYPIKKKVTGKLIAFVILVADMIFLTMSTYHQTINNTFDENPDFHYRFLSYHFNDYGTYPIFIAAVCIFVLLCDIKTTNKVVKFVLRQLGNTTLALYLLSYVFDRKIYPDFSVKYPDILDRCKHCFEPIGYVFIHALFWALIIQNVYDIILSLIRIASSKIKKKRIETAS
ncbi:MAG: acyltransferase family protein, partial [Eubacterium sp.]|nr:acyltransferase family protein [Eubacterium sp.]